MHPRLLILKYLMLLSLNSSMWGQVNGLFAMLKTRLYESHPGRLESFDRTMSTLTSF